MATETEKATALERLRKGEDEDLARVRERYASAYKDLGVTPPAPSNGGGGDNLKDTAAAEDTDAALFDRLSASGELAKISVEDPARFERLVEARRKAGERALFQAGGRP